MTDKADFGTYGVWRMASRLDGAFAQRVEQLGFGALWVGGSPAADLMIVEELLDATETIVVATGIVNIWTADARSVAQAFHRIEDAHPGRLVLGIGSGHREATPERARPFTALRAYLDVLDEEGVGKDQRLLAALGDRTLALAAERTLGAHPYLTVPAHTRHAREVLGEAFLAPELKVALAGSADEARGTGRAFLERYFRLENYVGALRRFGAGDDDVAGGGSDALVDAVVANPDVEDAVAGLRSHLDAGADHVSVQALGDDPLGTLERLAPALGLGAGD
ncbi:TIGR03620 family F420-dependent LLM class oxidoreductase [Microbacterium betulae]|uniref:TIGR03620 family F420-dependent LLM class oxidoreductase n=1 Tax=Microbacterium betulae TaxID=2981139 RepID=A0AA97FIS6_9MICO|nr:TIGR03620 family F420-dependent LLM class oxidoreductase [Microbacterium sp. AB]WOF23404.1 TIGR03620 family F420-dependent LLM class oxidoreductase [Microbacterium sp. AB]